MLDISARKVQKQITSITNVKLISVILLFLNTNTFLIPQTLTTKNKLMATHEKNEQLRRMVHIRANFPFKSYTAVYQSEYGMLDEIGVEHIRSVWNLQKTDEVVLARFETLLDKLKKS